MLDHAERCGNVSETCRMFGVSRTRYYEWKNVADRYGLEALMPKARRGPQLPNATPTHVVEQLLTLAVLEPPSARLADRLAEAGWAIAASTAQKHLSGPGWPRDQRVARAAVIAAATTGMVTDAARAAEPFGFCHFAAGGPASWLAWTASTSATSKAWASLPAHRGGRPHPLGHRDHRAGAPTGAHTARFVDRSRHWRRHGHALRAVVTDNGPEYIAEEFRAPLAAQVRHLRIPARSPNHNAVVRTLPRDHPPGMLASRLPPPTLHPPPTPSRRRRLADHLQPPATQPQRLHPRPDTAPNPHQPPQPTGIMKPSHRPICHLNPRPGRPRRAPVKRIGVGEAEKSGLRAADVPRRQRADVGAVPVVMGWAGCGHGSILSDSATRAPPPQAGVRGQGRDA